MIALLEQLIELLRDELKEYGELLALLNQQQEQVMARAANEVLQITGAIHNQGAIIQTARRRRQECQRELADRLGLGDDATFAQMLPVLPEAHRPLVLALVEENNHLLRRVQKGARQNHLLLSRSLELMQGFLGALAPTGRTAVYNAHGDVSAPALTGQRLSDVAG